MTKFIVIEKDSLNKATVDTAHISLNEASIVHTKLSRDDVAEFVRDGNNLILKLKNGESIVIENFFLTYDDVSSDLVFEEDGCVLYWFDGVSGFNDISGLEVLLPEAGSKLMGLLPWLVGAGVVGGVIAGVDDNGDKKENIPNGVNRIEIDTNGKIIGKTENIPEGTDVKITIIGKDKDGKPITHEETVKVDKDGNYAVNVPEGFADGDLKVESEVIDRNGKPVEAEDSLEKTDHDNDPNTPDQGGLDRNEGSITVDVDDKGNITGGTTDVEPGSDVKLTITGQDKDGNIIDREVTATVNPDGSYTAQVPSEFVDGDLTVKAETTDRNGKPVEAEDSLEKTDHDNDPNTPDQGGLDRDVGTLDINEINEDGTVIGQTTDVPIGSDVVLTFKDHNGDSIIDPSTGNPLTVTTTVKPDGSYEAKLPESVMELKDTVNVQADAVDNNGKPVTDNENVKQPIVDVTTNGDDSLTGTTGDDILAGDTGGLKTNFEAGHSYNVSIILDVSGSMGQNLDNNNNAVPPALSRLDIAKAGLKAFVEQMLQHEGTIIFRLTTFSAVGSTKGYAEFEVNQSNKDDIFDQIDNLVANGGTYPGDAFTDANNWFTSKQNGYENQTYYLTDGNPNESLTQMDSKFKPLAEQSKVFGVGISNAVNIDNVNRYDNTDVDGNKIPDWSKDNHGDAQQFTEADKLIAYLIGGSENFIPANVGDDTVKGGAGEDILFGDAMNTDWITGLDPLQYPQYSGYSKLLAHLKATVTGGVEPTQQQVYDFVKDNFQKFIDADANDLATKGGNDTIFGGSGNDIIIAGAGDDRIYGGSGDDIISTGRGDDTIVYDVLQAADATGGNGTDTWVDYEANDKIEFGTDFFEGLLADKSNISEYIKVEDVNGKAVLKVDRDGAAGNGGTTHDWADLLIIEGKTASELQDLINNQIVIG